MDAKAGDLFSSAWLCGLRRRSGCARTIRLYRGRVWSVPHPDSRIRDAKILDQRKIQSMAAGQVSHAVARQGETGDPVFDNYFASNVPSMDNREIQSRMNVDALAALLDRVGPSIVLVHSQSGQYGWPLAQARPALVKAIVAAEPSGPPVHDVVVPGEPRFGVDFASATAVAGTETFRDDPRLKRYGLSDIPMVYAPAVTSESPLAFVRQDKAEAPDLVKCWRQKEPAAGW